MIDYFKAEPLSVMYGDYYPPYKKYNSLLRKLRFLGIYHDEHIVSQMFVFVFFVFVSRFKTVEIRLRRLLLYIYFEFTWLDYIYVCVCLLSAV